MKAERRMHAARCLTAQKCGLVAIFASTIDGIVVNEFPSAHWNGMAAIWNFEVDRPPNQFPSTHRSGMLAI